MLGFLRLLAIVVVTLLAAPAAAECLLPDTPLLPEGRTASKDQMIAASRAVKAYQVELVAYRDCLDVETAALGEDGPVKERAQLVALHDDSVDLEDALATRFNSQVRDYKAAQK
jgi:hypothetical protein